MKTSISLFALGLAIGIGVATPVVSQSVYAQESRVFDFSIKAQPLSLALLEFGEKTGYQILFDSRLAQGTLSNGVTGSYRVDEALRELLKGSDLSYSITDNNTLILEAGQLEQSGETLTLDPITITGEGVARSLRDTASSVYVVDGERIQESPGPQTIETVINQAPNVLVNGTNSLAPTIRGSDTTGPLTAARGLIGGARPRSTINIDGRDLTYNEYVFGRFSVWDTRKVEVFMGPQTTNSGRNSISGAVFVETNDPTFDYEFDSQVLVGSSNTQQYSAVVSGPLIENQLAVRAAIDSRNHDTFVTQTGLRPDFPVSARDDDYLNGRLKFLLLPDDIPELSAKLTLARNDSVRPQSEAVDLPAENLVRNNDEHSVLENSTNSAVLDLEYEIDDTFTLRNVSSITRSETKRRQEPGYGNTDIELDEYASELYLDFDPVTLPFKGLIGTSVLKSDQEDYFNTSIITFGTGESDYDDEQLSFGLFGEVTYSFTEALDLTLGLRYQYDRQKRVGENRNGLVAIALDYEESFDAFLPKAALSYDVNDELTIGASVSKGFNPGGATLDFTTFTPDTFDEETLVNYELFTRASWLDNRLRTNANIFYTDFKDAQRLSVVNGVTQLDNADDARSFGAELSFEYNHSKELDFFGGMGLLQTEIESFEGSSTVVNGNEFQRAPNYNATFGVNYRPFEGWQITANGRLSDGYFSDDANTEINRVDSFFVADARLSYSYRNIETFAYVTNIFDEFYELEKRQHGTATAFSIVGDPREVGVGLRVRF
ncbi:TonB-dependent receptor [Kiloniella sp. b19]|uniref:TonB-dependent receptor n=1 Tax=Kiloniella sp. GXU_MW_B19 TaxID=3141326 RepID=UPI0031DB1482